MNFIVGVDGGGVKTEAVVATVEGEIIGFGRGGPSNINVASKKEVARSLRKAIFSALKKSGASGKALAGVLGVAGTERRDNAEAIREIALKLDFAERVIVTSDAMIALISATKMKPGIILISGTGSIAFGINSNGNTARAGGWGYILDDEGSGYWIGLRALREVMKAYDGRGRRTTLASTLFDHLNIEQPEDLVSMIYSGELKISNIASLAELVVKCAKMGDQVANEILREAGEKLAEMAAAVAKKLKFNSKVDIYYFGGVFKAGNLILKPLKNKLYELGVFAEFRKSELKPVVGAVILALKALGIDLDEKIWANLVDSAKAWGLAH